MYKISVPIMNKSIKRIGRERLLEELHRFDAKRVFIAIGCYESDLQKRKAIFEELKDNCRFFKEHDFEVE